MKNRFAVLFAVLALVASSLACAALSTELGLSNLRMAFDQDGQNLTSTYSHLSMPELSLPPRFGH